MQVMYEMMITLVTNLVRQKQPPFLALFVTIYILDSFHSTIINYDTSITHF